ncbi:MAG TPA: DUF1992 domain-containing protein [Streptosporangiaceae bacterium]|nr:DUF1992 domain-containing protein [Streptosporangiaceae bacterium]
MTERKPAGITFGSWIDQQISEATERGAFDNLPGSGQPLSKRNELDGESWVRDWVARAGGSPEDCLPTPLKLRKEIERLAVTVPGLRSEDEVREAVGELNERIRQWRRLPLGPPIFVPLVDEHIMISKWTEAQASPVTPEPTAPPTAPATARASRRRWRRGRRRQDR